MSFIRPGRSAGSPPVGGDPFPWFTAFDMNDFLPHTQSGVWGPQRPILPPAAAVESSTGTAGNNTQLDDALSTPGTTVTLTTSLTGGVFNSTNITDVRVIVPPGIKWDSPTIGNGASGITVTRFIVSGTTLGTRSGGQLNNFNFIPVGSDAVVDGLDVYGSVTASCLALGPAAGFNKMAVVNCRLNSDGFGIGSTCSNIVVAGCSIMTGNDLAFPPGNDEAYGFRAYHESLGNVIMVLCDVRSNPGRATSSHARFRGHPDPGMDYYGIIKCRLVDRVENWMGLVWSSGGGGSGVARALWWTQNDMISDGTGTDPGAPTPKLYSEESTPGTRDVDYTYVQNNTFRSPDFTSNADIGMQGEVNGAAGISDNAFTSLPGSDPAWSATTAAGVSPGCGDPTGIVA